MTLVPLVTCALFLGSLLVLEERCTSRLWPGLAKGGASVSFLAFGLAFGLASAGTAGRIALVAFALSLLGDLLLVGHSRGPFLAGICCFLLAHVAFAATFWKLGVTPAGLAFAALPVVLFCVLAGRWLLPVAGELRPAVAGYIVVIGAMMVFAGGAVIAQPILPRFGIAVGAVLFAVSDLTVARERFVTKSHWNQRIGLPLYYGAQLLLAASIAASIART